MNGGSPHAPPSHPENGDRTPDPFNRKAEAKLTEERKQLAEAYEKKKANAKWKRQEAKEEIKEKDRAAREAKRKYEQKVREEKRAIREREKLQKRAKKYGTLNY